MKVLLVEDEEFIRDLFKRQLDLSGFTTDAFGTGQDGLNALTKNSYDLVLLDIMLPDVNGLQILQNIRQDPTTKTVAVVLLTNLGQDAVIKQGFELGADGYLVKAAYTPDQIVQEVKNIMQKKQTQNSPGGAPGTPVIPEPAIAATPSPAPVQSAPIPGGFTPPPAEPAASTPMTPSSASEVVSEAVSSDAVTPDTGLAASGVNPEVIKPNS
jgi:DNA-binding response OmpR family regulator